MGKYVRCPNIKNIDAAVRLYYEKFELSSKDIRLIFDTKSTATESKLKNMVRMEMSKAERKPWDEHCVPTDLAYKVWGLDITDLERRRAKLVKLGVISDSAPATCADFSPLHDVEASASKNVSVESKKQ